MRKLFLLIFVLLAGCAPGGSLSLPTPTGTSAAVVVTPTAPLTVAPPTLAPPPTATIAPVAMTGTPTSDPSCAFVAAEQDVPEITRQINQAYQNAGMPDVSGRATAYGENCVGQDGKVQRFSAMQTDLYVTVPVKDLKDKTDLGNMAAKVLPVLVQFTPDLLKGPNPGKIGIRFKTETDEINLVVARNIAEELVQQGIRGELMFEALSGR